MELLDCGLVEDVLLDRGTPRDDVQAFVVWVLVDSCRERMLAVIGESSLEGEILEMTDATIH
jgi:hypothetical protein